MILTPGRLLFEEIVPPHLRDGDDGAPIDAGRIKTILQNVAEKEPTSYRDISHKLLKLGARASTEVSASFGLDDLESPIDKATIVAGVRKQEALINANPKLSPAQKIHERVKLYGQLSNDLPEQVFSAAMGRGSNLAKMVASGARGSKGQLNSNIGADFLMLDANSNPIPVPITHSYAEGLSPGEYFASAYGTRRGLLSTKLCCSGDTKVLMGDFSEKEIRDIKVGEWVIGATKDGRSLRVQVKNVFSNGIKECWRHVFRRLSSRLETVEVCATADHQLLARKRDWGNDKDRAIEAPTKIAAGRMTKTRHVLVPVEGGNFGGIPEPRALLLGLLMGDGCLTSQKHLLFSCADQVLLDDIREYLAELNFEASRGRSETSYSYIFKYLVWPKRIGHECGCPTKAWLGKIGMMGKYAHEKEIPTEVWSWDNDSIASLLAGIYSTDGSIYTTKAATGGIGIGIALCLTSRQMLEQTKRLLEKRFGIYGGAVYHVPKEQKEHAKRDQWHFNINHRHAVELFAQHIPLVGKKRLTLESLRGQKAPSRCNEQYTFKFLHRELVGEIPTYDIEVDHPDHLFVLANGIISSNSISESGYLSKQLSAAAHDLVVTKHNCDTERGIPVRPDDTDSIGSVLARPVSGYQAGTIVTGKMLRDIRDKKIPSMTVRSPLTCAAHNGICAVCAGIREKNRFPRIMENVGLAAASSVGEPLNQGTLSEKHCLFEDTLVRMADWSTKMIKDIKEGDFVLGSDMDGVTLPVKVLEVFNNGLRECHEIGFLSGRKEKRTLVATLDHKALSRVEQVNSKGWKLKNGMFPVGNKRKRLTFLKTSGFIGQFPKEDPWALVMGMIVGDGCCVESVGAVTFSCGDPLLIQDTESCLVGLNLKLTKLKGHKHYYRFSQINEIKAERNEAGQFSGSHRNPAAIKVREWGMYGKYAHEKSLPKDVYSWSNASISQLMAGLFATDGSFYLSSDGAGRKLQISFTSTSKTLIEQMRDLLEWRFGVHVSRINHYSKEKIKGAAHDAFDFKISNSYSVRRFLSAIDVPGIKRHTIQKLLKNARPGKNHPEMNVFRRTTMTLVGARQTMDLMVDHPDHLFVLANGLIVSNSGGVASSSGKAVSAFKMIDSLVQIPDVFPNAAAIARNDGEVSKIEEAPQGGSYVHVGAERHYVPRGRDILVKRGDKLEAGDVLSAGIPNPAEIVQYKGIGEGRLYFVNALRKAMTDNKLPVDRRNLEILGRSLVNHVRVTDPEGYGGNLPDDIVEYDSIEHGLIPLKTKPVAADPSKSLGRYLAKPVMHYSIGTRITPSVARSMHEGGESAIDTIDESPGFEPEMQRVADIPGFKSDYMAQMAGSNLKRRLQRNVYSGDAISDIHSTSYIPGLAKGTEFGKPPKGVVGY